jgi:hypothetical protein
MSLVQIALKKKRLESEFCVTNPDIDWLCVLNASSSCNLDHERGGLWVTVDNKKRIYEQKAQTLTS